MPRKKPDEKLFSWEKRVPEAERAAARAEWMEEEVVRNYLGAYADQTQSRQEAARYKQMAEQGQQLAAYLQPYQDLLPNLPRYANVLRSHKAEDIEAAVSQTRAGLTANVQQQQQLLEANEAGEVPWEQVQRDYPRLQREHQGLQREYQTLATRLKQVEEFTQAAPQIVRAWETNVKTLADRQVTDKYDVTDLNAQLIQYNRRHPDRDLRPLIQELKQHPQVENFDDLAATVYSDEDRAEEIARARKEERDVMTKEFEERQAKEAEERRAQQAAQGDIGPMASAPAYRRLRNRTNLDQETKQALDKTVSATDKLRNFFVNLTPQSGA